MNHRSRRLLLSLLLALMPAPALAQSSVRFAVIGDYGGDNANELAVSNAVQAAAPEFVTTVGDNNYLASGFTNWDNTQGKYYAPYIKLPASSAYLAQGAAVNAFYPILGNHDWDAIGNWNGGNNDYANYFGDMPSSALGGKRFYTFTKGPVQFFMLSSDPREPSGYDSLSAQAAWLQTEMAASVAQWKIVQIHHPPYTSLSNVHGPTLSSRWDFKAMGASAVISGDNHFYERLHVDGLPYFINGAGGGGGTHFVISQDPNSQFYNDTEKGFMLVTADQSQMTLQYLNTAGVVRDTFILSVLPEPPALAFCLLGLGASAVFLRRRCQTVQ